jgi:hypothetical protein
MAAPKKRSNKKQRTASESVSEDLNLPKEDLSKMDQALVDQLIAQALTRFKTEDAEKKVKVKELTQLSIVAEEFLSSFAIIGYSLEGEKSIILNMPTAKDEAAIVDLLRATYIDMANNRP